MLSMYIDNELNQDEKNLVFKHLETCTDCKNELEQLNKIKRLFLLKEGVREPEFFEMKLFNRIKSQNNNIIFPTKFLRRLIPVFIPTIVVLVMIVFLIFHKSKYFRKSDEVFTDILLTEQIEKEFDNEVIRIYYNNFIKE